MSRDLPEFPNIEHLRKQAKALLRVLQRRDSQAQLSEAQHALANEYGFPSWVKLKDHVEGLPVPEKPVPLASPPAPFPGGFSRYTEAARKAIFFAIYWARRRQSQLVEPVHLLLGLRDAAPGMTGRLTSAEVQDSITLQLAKIATPKEAMSGPTPPLSNGSRRVLRGAVDEADRLGHEHIKPSHILLSALGPETAAVASVFFKALDGKDRPLNEIRDGVLRLLREDKDQI